MSRNSPAHVHCLCAVQTLPLLVDRFSVLSFLVSAKQPADKPLRPSFSLNSQPPNRLSGLYSSSGPSSTSPPNAGRTGTAFNNIPLTTVPGSFTTAANTPYQPVATHNQPWSADSMDDLHAPISREQNPFSGGTPMLSSRALPDGAGTGSGGRASYTGSEPKLGAYAPGAAWSEPNRPKSNKRKWVVRISPHLATRDS